LGDVGNILQRFWVSIAQKAIMVISNLHSGEEGLATTAEGNSGR